MHWDKVRTYESNIIFTNKLFYSIFSSNLDVSRTIDKRGGSKYYLRLDDESEMPIKYEDLQNIMRHYGVDMSLSER